MISAVVITETQELDPHLDDWDRLAVLRGQPYSAPAWMLAWWRHASPPGARLAVVIVSDDDRVIGVAPMLQRRTRAGLWVARLLGTGHRVEPLAEPGREWEVAGAAVDALRGLPDPPGPSSSTAGTPARRGRRCSPAPGRGPPPPSGASSSGRPRCGWRAGGTTTGSRSGAATSAASTAGAAASSPSAGRRSAWWARATMSRRRSRHSSPSPSTAGCSTWAPAGAPRGSGRCCSRRPRDLVPRGRMRIWTLEAEGRAISTQVFLAAAGEVAYWNGGYDERWAKLRPGFETIIRAIEHSFARGGPAARPGRRGHGLQAPHDRGRRPHPLGPAAPGRQRSPPPARPAPAPGSGAAGADQAARRAPDWVQRRLRAMRG